MGKASGAGKVYLFLQGPHGPFFHQLSRVLKTAGAEVLKVGFNRGDQAFWKDRSSYVPYFGKPEDYADWIDAFLKKRGVTDIVLYGDTRPVNAEAITAARKSGITVHCFEEGYLRPYWVTYERGGVNGNSRLCEMSIEEMCAALANRDLDLPDAPARWGDMRHHAYYGALYHGHILFRNGAYKNYRTHRDVSVLTEFRYHFRRLLSIPLHALQRIGATMRIRRDGYVYHLALLQLSHDASIQHHSTLRSMPEFIRLVIEKFSEGAPQHHHLVIKTHPFEDGRLPLHRITRDTAMEFGVSDRVHFVRGGKLAGLLNFARSVVTVNSTAAQQALWRGLPLKALGNSVYRKPEFVSEQPLDEFFADPWRPDARAYRDYRHYLLETSQIMGGFYSAKGRRRLIRGVIDRLLAAEDPYDSLKTENAAPRQQFRVVN